MSSTLVFRKGLDLKQAVAAQLNENYHSELVEKIKADGFLVRAGRLTLHIAREFGFCYGVDRAVDYAYQTRERFPDRRIFLTGEIIHNPHVNDRLRNLGIRFLSDAGTENDLGPSDVVVLPAFGVTTSEMQRFENAGCVLVDTTCGSVLNVWKNVKRYAEDGFTSIIHGKVWHEETRATPDRQDAVVNLLKDMPLDLMIVIGGYNSSNTCNLARMGAAKVPTFHIADPDCLESADAIRHRPAGGHKETRTTGWLPLTGPVSLGLTSGASTPDNQVGTTVERLTTLCR